jgi:DMSO/TMAO reductase YedYZ molybdopterin-dependent catalytic subunit
VGIVLTVFIEVFVMHSFYFLKRVQCLLSLLALVFIMCSSCTNNTAKSNDVALSVKGAVKNEKSFTLKELKALPSFFLKDVYLINEKANCADDEKLDSLGSYRGVLLRDLLLEAGLKFKRKWEPGVYVRVKNKDKEVVFSFGELFYSSIGRSAIIAYQKNGKEIDTDSGLGQLIIHTDLRSGRSLKGLTEIIVERVDVEMKAYDDKKEEFIRPPTETFTLLDNKTSINRQVTLENLKALKQVSIPHALMAGDCEGFGGIYSFEGTPLRQLLEISGLTGCNYDYSRYVLIESEDGFCATFSFGEIFNSRLSDNIVIAYIKNNNPLDAKDGFAMSAVREDSTGGRSVKRIYKIEVF